MTRILRAEGRYCDVVPLSGGVFGFVWSGAHVVVGEIEGHELWRTSIADSALLYLRAASSPRGAMAVVGVGQESDRCLFVDAGGGLDLGPAAGQDAAVIRWRHDLQAFELWWVADRHNYAHALVSEIGRELRDLDLFPLADVGRAGTSQGIRDVFDDGSLLWGDGQRPVVASEHVLTRWHMRGYAICGEKSADDFGQVIGAALAWSTAVRYVTVFAGACYPPNIAVQGDRVAICSWTPRGTECALLAPPYPPHEPPLEAAPPVEDDMKAPKVNIVSYGRMLKLGEPWGAVVEDPNNRSVTTFEFLPKGNAWDFHVGIVNPIDRNRSGLERLVSLVLPAPPTPPPSPAGSIRDILLLGESLLPGQELRSADRRFALIYQLDGNLVLLRRRDGLVLWASGTDGQVPERVELQQDGNLVVSAADETTVWASDTAGHGLTYLLLQNDGNLVVYDRGTGAALWASNTARPDDTTPPPDDLVVLPRLVRRGQFFYLETGEPWQPLENSDFSLFKRDLEGENVEPIFLQRDEVGFNLLRVWILNKSVVGRRNNVDPNAPPHDDGIHPGQYPDFYERLGQFADRAAQHHQYLEVGVFTSAGSLMPERADQQAHLDRATEVLRGKTNVIVELVNEADQWDNAYNRDKPMDEHNHDVTLLAKPEGVIVSHGSNGADRPPVMPAWDYVLYHTNGLSEWWRKTGHNAMEYADRTGVPGWSNENTRYVDQDDSPEHAYDAAMGGALLAAGAGCFHSQQGKYSRLFDGKTLECARAWVAGARSVPLEFRIGRYFRRDDLLGPDCIRAYERRLPDGRSYIIKIRP